MIYKISHVPKITGQNIGFCAEDLVVQQLGGNAKDILFTPAYRPRDGSIIPVCPRCQLQYSRNQFPPGTTFGTKKKK